MRQFAIILTIIFSLAVNTVQAQYASVNVDYKTMEAMSVYDRGRNGGSSQ